MKRPFLIIFGVFLLCLGVAVHVRQRGRYVCQEHIRQGIETWNWYPARSWPIGITLQENRPVFICEYHLVDPGTSPTWLVLVDWDGKFYQTPADRRAEAESDRRYGR